MHRNLPFWEASLAFLLNDFNCKIGILPTCGGWKPPPRYYKDKKAET